MARTDFAEALLAIEAELSPELFNKLSSDLGNNSTFWDSEACWAALYYWLEDNVGQDSSNGKSVKIYSILFDCSEEEMWKRFKDKGL